MTSSEGAEKEHSGLVTTAEIKRHVGTPTDRQRDTHAVFERAMQVKGYMSAYAVE